MKEKSESWESTRFRFIQIKIHYLQIHGILIQPIYRISSILRRVFFFYLVFFNGPIRIPDSNTDLVTSIRFSFAEIFKFS